MAGPRGRARRQAAGGLRGLAAGRGAGRGGAARAALEAALPEPLLPVRLRLPRRAPPEPNGKVDRRALPAPDRAAVDGGGRRAAHAGRRDPRRRLRRRCSGSIGWGCATTSSSSAGTRCWRRGWCRGCASSSASSSPLRGALRDADGRGARGAGRDRCAAAPAARRAADPPRQGGESPPLSFAQQRLWFLDRLQPGTAVYNIPLALRLRGSLSAPALAAALAEIVRRHEVLRTVFALEAGEPVQVDPAGHGPSVPNDRPRGAA